MFPRDQYELLDFGRGRKLERFGPFVLDRPSPAVSDVALGSGPLWAAADGRYIRRDAATGDWTSIRTLPASWNVRHGGLVFELRCSPSGAIGVYPEQAENWDWIERQVRRAGPSPRVLNLFAYTGGSTLAAAAAGAAAVHVDSARPVVQWARRNAELSQLAQAPIRWIVDDARRFVQRELRRGNQYQGIILDPPTYGHGSQAKPWELATDLPDLLRACARLTRESRAFMLLTCHTPTFGPAEIEALLGEVLCGHCQGGVKAKALSVRTAEGRRLPCGVVARWPGA